MYARSPNGTVADACSSAGGSLTPPALSSFAPARIEGRRQAHTLGIAAVIAVHGLAAMLYALGAPTFMKPEATRPVVVIDVPPELAKPVDPPPPPQFQPPPVYVPVPIVPEIVLATPPPQPRAITIPPAAPQPPAPPAPATEPNKATTFSGDMRSAYIARLLKHLNAYKRYPQGARMRREQGVVSLRFRIDRSGHVLSAAITRGSGSEALDSEAVAAIRRADPLPRIPDIFARESLDLVVPVEFILR